MDTLFNVGAWFIAILLNVVSIFILIKLFLRKQPSHPPAIENESAVIDWFIKHDQELKIIRKNFNQFMFEKFKQNILDDLKNNPNAESLQKFIEGATEFWGEMAFPQAALRTKQGYPTDGETKEEWMEIILSEQYLAAKLRILGFFLLKKYGIQCK